MHLVKARRRRRLIACEHSDSRLVEARVLSCRLNPPIQGVEVTLECFAAYRLCMPINGFCPVQLIFVVKDHIFACVKGRMPNQSTNRVRENSIIWSATQYAVVITRDSDFCDFFQPAYPKIACRCDSFVIHHRTMRTSISPLHSETPDAVDDVRIRSRLERGRFSS